MNLTIVISSKWYFCLRVLSLYSFKLVKRMDSHCRLFFSVIKSFFLISGILKGIDCFHYSFAVRLFLIDLGLRLFYSCVYRLSTYFTYFINESLLFRCTKSVFCSSFLCSFNSLWFWYDICSNQRTFFVPLLIDLSNSFRDLYVLMPIDVILIFL